MRDITTQSILVDGASVKATLITDPNIDDVLIAEAQAFAYNVVSGTSEPDRKVDRSIREMLLRFGVQR